MSQCHHDGHRRDTVGTGFAAAVDVGDGELTSPLLPGFALDVDGLFADLE